MAGCRSAMVLAVLAIGLLAASSPVNARRSLEADAVALLGDGAKAALAARPDATATASVASVAPLLIAASRSLSQGGSILLRLHFCKVCAQPARKRWQTPLTLLQGDPNWVAWTASSQVKSSSWSRTHVGHALVCRHQRFRPCGQGRPGNLLHLEGAEAAGSRETR